MNPDFRSLSDRIETLEAQNRRLKKFGVVGGLFGTLALVGFAAPVLCDIVTGERLVIRDSYGRTRFGMDAYHNEAPGITLHDSAGRQRAKLGVDEKGDVTLSFSDEKGNAKASYLFAANGAPKAEEPRTGQDKPAKTDPSIANE